MPRPLLLSIAFSFPLFLFSSHPVSAAPPPPAQWSLQSLWDSRGFPLLHLDFNQPRRGTYALTGYIDYQGRTHFDGADHFSLQRHLAEGHFAYWFADAFALDAEVNSLTGNAVQGRLGVRWYPPVSLGPRSRLFVRLSPLQSGARGGQMSLVGGASLGERWAWNFWADFNTTQSVGGDITTVAEVTLRYRPPRGPALLAKYRVNGFRPPSENDGVAVGVEFPLN